MQTFRIHQVGNIPRAQYALHEENEFERNNMCIEHTLIKHTCFKKSSPFGLYYKNALHKEVFYVQYNILVFIATYGYKVAFLIF